MTDEEFLAKAESQPSPDPMALHGMRLAIRAVQALEAIAASLAAAGSRPRD